MESKNKNNITEIVFIIDRSGSMQGFEDDTVGGFNSTIAKQREKDGKVYVSTVLFDNESSVVHDRVLIDEVKPMTREDYVVGGSTALLDAVGSCHRVVFRAGIGQRDAAAAEGKMFLCQSGPP